MKLSEEPVEWRLPERGWRICGCCILPTDTLPIGSMAIVRTGDRWCRRKFTRGGRLDGILHGYLREAGNMERSIAGSVSPGAGNTRNVGHAVDLVSG